MARRESRSFAPPAEPDGHGAVCLRARDGEEPVGDLTLHHHAPVLEERRALEGLDHERRGDVVREVRDELSRLRIEGAEIEGERVGEDQPHVLVGTARGRERLLERTVDLHGMHETDARREVAREDSKAGADLQHDVVPP